MSEFEIAGVSEMRSQSDHPVCGASVASRLLIDAADTLLCKEGKCLWLHAPTVANQLEERYNARTFSVIAADGCQN